MKRILTLGALLLSTGLTGADPQSPVAHMTSDCIRHPSVIDAVTQALACATRQAQGTKYEYGGVIYRLEDGGYCFTHPVTSGNSKSIAYRVSRRYPIVAMYHTHTTGSLSELFSPADVQAVLDMRVPSFIGALDSLAIYRVDFSEVRDVFAKRLRPAKRTGTLVGAVPDTAAADRGSTLADVQVTSSPQIPAPDLRNSRRIVARARPKE